MKSSIVWFIYFDYLSDKSDGNDKSVYDVEFMCSSKDKQSMCDSLKLIHKNWQEEHNFTFHVAKYDKIFDELLQPGKINCCTLYHRLF
jgi:hypothetical protein